MSEDNEVGRYSHAKKKFLFSLNSFNGLIESKSTMDSLASSLGPPHTLQSSEPIH